MENLKEVTGHHDETDLVKSYGQYFTAHANAVHGVQDASSFTIYTAYDYSIPVSFSDSSVPKVLLKHA